MFEKAKQFLKEVIEELKKVSWIGKKEVIASTAVVILLVIILAIYVGGVDFFLSEILKFLLR